MDDRLKTEHLISSIARGLTATQLLGELDRFDLDQVGERGRTPLMVAAAEGALEVVKLLVQKGASVSASGHLKMTALHEAAANGEEAVASCLLSLGAEVDAATLQGATPLMCAAAWGHDEVGKLLLMNGASPSKTDDRGASAEDIAREKGQERTANMIKSYATE